MPPGPTVAAGLRDLAAYLLGMRDLGAATDLLAAVATSMAHARVQDRLHARVSDALDHALAASRSAAA